jgi:outer membrane protein OmpA-like peptidoglycan-associated protein
MLALSVGLPLAAEAADPAIDPGSIPMSSGLTIVQAVADPSSGDYEATLRIVDVSPQSIRLQGSAYTQDDRGERRWLTVQRDVLLVDLDNARRQILGFHTDDPQVLPGATALGPSRLVMQELAGQASAEHVVRNYYSRRDNRGTLRLVQTSPVPFPLLVNGRRVTVPALQARGSLGIPGSLRPFEFYLLDHPVQPLTLKVSYGAENSSSPVPSEWSRQVVRIDFPQPKAAQGLEDELDKACRTTVPGIYFEFNSDMLNPASAPALKTIAAMLREHAEWNIEIEGHTDNVGGARYNLDLSNRRAASVQRALVEEHGIKSARLTTRGYGLERPVESNDTAEGRARNRRVELVRPCLK